MQQLQSTSPEHPDIDGSALQPEIASHPLSEPHSDDDNSQRSGASRSESYDSIELGKRPSLAVDEQDAPLRKHSCLRRSPTARRRASDAGTALRVTFCAQLCAVRTLEPDHKAEALDGSWFSVPGWDPARNSREAEADAWGADWDSDSPPQQLSKTELDMLAADEKYEKLKNAARAAYAAELAAGSSSDSDDDASSGLSSATDDESEAAEQVCTH